MLSAGLLGSLAGFYLLLNSQTLSEAERVWCDLNMSQVAVAAMQVNPKPSGLIGDALADHGASPVYWESTGQSTGRWWRSVDEDTFNRACKFAVAFTITRSR